MGLTDEFPQPTPEDIRIAHAVGAIPGTGSGTPAYKNIKLINNEITEEATRTRASMAGVRQDPITGADLQRMWDKIDKNLKETAFLVGNAERAGKGIRRAAEAIIAKHPKTATGLLDARIAVDKWVMDQKPNIAGDMANVNALNIAFKTVRDGLNSLIAAKAPTVAVRESLWNQHRLLKAADNIADKRARDLETAWSSLVKTAGVAAVGGGVTGSIAALAGVGGATATALGSGVAFAVLGSTVVRSRFATRKLDQILTSIDNALGASDITAKRIKQLRIVRQSALEILRRTEDIGMSYGQEGKKDPLKITVHADPEAQR